LLRKERELTLKEVAKAVGLAEPTLGNFETGKADLSAEALKRLADYFKVSPAELLEEVGAVVPVLKEGEPEYEAKFDVEALRWSWRKADDEQLVGEISAALLDPAMEWRNRIATARALLGVLEWRHRGE
jgi:transcriptional regulator with XRE-family HTH domain